MSQGGGKPRGVSRLCAFVTARGCLLFRAPVLVAVPATSCPTPSRAGMPPEPKFDNPQLAREAEEAAMQASFGGFIVPSTRGWLREGAPPARPCAT